MTFYSTVELLAQGLLCSLVGTPHLFISLLEKCHEVILVNLQLKAVAKKTAAGETSTACR